MCGAATGMAPAGGGRELAGAVGAGDGPLGAPMAVTGGDATSVIVWNVAVAGLLSGPPSFSSFFSSSVSGVGDSTSSTTLFSTGWRTCL